MRAARSMCKVREGNGSRRKERVVEVRVGRARKRKCSGVRSGTVVVVSDVVEDRRNCGSDEMH